MSDLNVFGVRCQSIGTVNVSWKWWNMWVRMKEVRTSQWVERTACLTTCFDAYTTCISTIFNKLLGYIVTAKVQNSVISDCLCQSQLEPGKQFAVI